MASKTSFICPYCFKKTKLSEVQFRCTNKRCADVDDIEMTIYEQGNLSMPKKGKRTFTVKSKNPMKVPSSALCPDCNNKTHKNICPHCHNILPESSITGKDMIISIVGSRGTGKSHFVGVIIKELRDRISVAFGGSLEGFDDSLQRWQENFGEKLYNTNEKLDLTQSSISNTNNGAYRPMIFKLKLPKKSFLKTEIDCFTFVFFDTAGEDLNDEDTMATVNRYICNSAGIIFLLDPMQIQSVANQLDDTVVKRASAIDARSVSASDQIMTRVSNLIRNDLNLPENKKIDIPVAAVFSKYDAIVDIVPEGFVVSDTSPHCVDKKFNEADWHNVNTSIKGLLDKWGETSFTASLETNYSNFSFFAASALGLDNNPTIEGRIQKPRPHRVEDPLLWLLKENKVIQGK